MKILLIRSIDYSIRYLNLLKNVNVFCFIINNHKIRYILVIYFEF